MQNPIQLLATSGRSPQHQRGGTTIVECAIVLPVLFFVLFALLDLGIAATRYNSLAEASRRIAREAILHGSLRLIRQACGDRPSTTERWPTVPRCWRRLRK